MKADFKKQESLPCFVCKSRRKKNSMIFINGRPVHVHHAGVTETIEVEEKKKEQQSTNYTPFNMR